MNQPYNWKELERHPLSGEYKDIQGWAWQDFLEGLKQHGVLNERKITLYEGMILDGWQLQRACLELNKMPLYQELPQGVGPEEFVAAMNDNRRHESEASLQARRKKRMERVAQARLQGQPFSQIAEQAGVSEKTVRDDFEAHQGAQAQASNEENGEGVQEAQATPQEPEKVPEKITGKDGKSYSAKKPKKVKQVCKRCQKTPVKGCQYCEDMNRKAKRGSGKKGQGKAKPKQEASQEDGPKDCFGTVLPKRCRDKVLDPWVGETLDFLTQWSTKFLEKRLATGMSKRKKQLPFFNAQGFSDGVGFIGQYLDQLIAHLKDCRPEAVCPRCKGGGCGDCLQAGVVPRKLHAKIKAKMKEGPAQGNNGEQGEEAEQGQEAKS
jgi:hypothetical protein